MYWTKEQQNRLNKEWELIQQYFPEFKLKYVDTRVCIEGWMKTNLSTKYQVRLYIPRDMPNSIPEVLILYPEHLIDYHGRALVDYGQDAAMHLLTPHDGYPSICTFKPTHWNPNRTLYNVLMKVRIWLEAYQGHLVTGRPLDYFIRHQV